MPLWLRACSVVSLCAALSAAWVTPASSQMIHHTVNLSFLHPVATNRTPDESTNFRLSLLYGHLHSIQGVDFNLGASVIDRKFAGVQLTGLYTRVGSTFRGVGLSVGPNYYLSDLYGVQASVFPNVVMGNLRGVQLSVMTNFLGGDIQGAQVSAILNQSDGGGTGAQISSLANALSQDFRGAQIAAGLNYSRARVEGAQIGVYNIASWIEGAQVGVINLSGQADGVQFGAINVSTENRGVPIGLINVADNGGVELIAYGTNLAAFNLGVRTVVNRVYSDFTAGGYNVETESDAAFLSWNTGYAYPLSNSVGIGADLGWVHIMPKLSDDPAVNDNLHFATQARVIGQFALGARFGVFAGGGASIIFSEYSTHARSETKPLFLGGLSWRIS